MQKIHEFKHDYIDSFSVEIPASQHLTPREVGELLLSRFPKWIRALMKLRNLLVKPFGLKGSEGKSEQVNYKVIIESLILHEDRNEMILGESDKHLTFHVSIYCSEVIEQQQKVIATTIVKYHNLLGKVYFFFVKPFHAIIVKSILNTLLKNH